MAQPTRYERGESFTDYAIAHPAAPFPPANLESELNDIVQTTDEICENLALLQRDDGELLNGVVGPDALSASALLLMAGSWVPRGAWETAYAYVPTDVVKQDGIGYVCAVGHTSGVFATDNTAGKWVPLGAAATDVSFTPTGSIAATTVAGAIAEVSGDADTALASLAAHLGDATDAHAASAITNTPAGTISATTVQAAINELDATIGALFPTKTDITGDVTIANTVTHIPHRITASATISLPQASTCDAGDPFIFKSYTTGSVQLAPNGSDTIDNVNANLRLASFECIELRPVGNDWIVTRKPAWEVGNVKAHDGSAVPAGWVARGSLVSRTDYAGLFAVAGTTFGAGDGSTTFAAGGASAGRVLVGEGTGTEVASGVNADVDTGTDGFTVPSNADKWDTGMEVVFSLASGTITGLTSGNTYYVVRASATLIKLATTLALAQNGTVVDLTAKSSPVWTITHTLSARTRGDSFGKETKAQSSTESLAHTHTTALPRSQGANNNNSTYGGGDSQNATSTPATSSFGGNVAMRTAPPSSVTKFIIKT